MSEGVPVPKCRDCKVPACLDGSLPEDWVSLPRSYEGKDEHLCGKCKPTPVKVLEAAAHQRKIEDAVQELRTRIADVLDRGMTGSRAKFEVGAAEVHIWVGRKA